MKVLIVDDEKAILCLVEDMVTKMGHECHLAHDGQSAYEILKDDFTFDVIICDFNMPFMTGLELRLKIESEFMSCPPFILVSGDITQVKEEKHKRMFYDLLQKPSGIARIVDKLEEIEGDLRENLTLKRKETL